MKKLDLVIGLSFGFLLGGCAGSLETKDSGADVDDPAQGLQVQSVPTVAGDVSVSEPGPGDGKTPGPGLQRLVDMAVRDLAARLGVEPAEIEILSAEFVTWRDSSVGCPIPGTEYMQVLTNGSRIRLQVNGRLFHYHSGANRPPFHCGKPQESLPAPYAPDEA